MPTKINDLQCIHCSFRSLLFDKVENQVLEKLNASKNEYIFYKGERIVNEGDEIKQFLYLKKGLIKLSKKSTNRRDQIISISKPKNFIGFLDVFSKENFNYSITALERCEVCFIDISVMKEIIGSNGQFALKVLSKICHISDEIIFNRVSICSRQLRGRLAFLLLYLSEEIFNKNEFELPLTRREMGELIAVSTENVIRILSEFRKEGILELIDKKVRIVDAPHLQMISKVN